MLVTVLTKRMAEISSVHARGRTLPLPAPDIDTLERIEIIRDLRLGAFDVLVIKPCCAGA